MIITSKTKYVDFQPYEGVVTEEGKADLMRAAEDFFKPCYMLTLDEFWGLMQKDFHLLGDMTEPSVLQVYWLKRFQQFCEEFTKTCEKLSTKEPNEEALQVGCVKLQPQESMLVFVRSYFGLQSFEEAGRCTIGEYVLARKDQFNQWRLKKNYEAKQIQELKKRSKR